MLRRSTAWLEKRGVERPRLDVEILMAHALGVRRLDLYLQFDRPLADPELGPLRALVRERGEGRPVAYLVGRRDFYSLPFAVDARVLVPRPETELLVEQAVERLRGVAAPCVLDVGTGSGCIAVALLHALPEARGVATDLSPEALEVAAANAETNGVSDRLTLRTGDLLGALDASDGPFDAVLSNPPYIVRGDPNVEPGVDAHEPGLALYVPGDDGLELAVRIADGARRHLRADGFLALEVGFGQAVSACERLTALGYADVTATCDLGGIERIVSGRWGG